MMNSEGFSRAEQKEDLSARWTCEIPPKFFYFPLVREVIAHSCFSNRSNQRRGVNTGALSSQRPRVTLFSVPWSCAWLCCAVMHPRQGCIMHMTTAQVAARFIECLQIKQAKSFSSQDYIR